jgi:Ca-activated chloride channel family protein
MDDDKMTDDTLSTLKLLRTSAPSSESKKLALNAAMLAFDAAQPKAAPAKRNWLNRWTLGAGLGVPLGTAVAALVLLPLGTQLYTATSHHIDVPKKDVTIATTDLPAHQDEGEAAKTVATTAAPANATPPSTSTMTLKQAPTLQKPMTPVAPPVDADQRAVAQGMVTTEDAPQTDALATVAPAPVPEAVTRDMTVAAPKLAAPMPANDMLTGGLAQQPASVVPYQPSGDTFQKFDENRTKITKTDPVSTFSIDVDTASYSYVRGVLKDGNLPDPDAVRLEEMINYFPYDYPAPTSLDTPFKATMAVIPTPWNDKTELLEIGIKGYVPPPSERKPENLTFLIDTSGSMDEPNKLPLLKRSFGLLVDTLQPNDTVSIVTYAGSAGVALKATKAKDRSTILSAIDALEPEGSTDGVDGIALAYRVNAEAKGDGTVNRVILATDGDFNVGIDEPDQLKTYIKTQRDQGIFLSVMGFGRGNLDDALMQALAQNGNGNASYIDNFQEAQKVLVEEGGANMVTIAKDVKIQVEFNPAQVSEYRLIGYETRALANEDFNNDKVDAGEIGAGHTVTAIYEITPAGAGADLNDPLRYATSTAASAPVSDELGFLKMRYKAPEGDTSKLISTPITKDLVVANMDAAGIDQRFAAAVAAFGQKLKGSNYGETLSWQQITDLANGAKGADIDGYRAEFVQLVKIAGLLNPDHNGNGKSIYDDPNGGKGQPTRGTGGQPTAN